MRRSTCSVFRPILRGAMRTSLRAGHDTGSALFEFAMVLPLLTLLLVGIIKAGIYFYDYVVLADAVAVGARELATNRGNANACTLAQTYLTDAAYNLNTANIQITISFPSPDTSDSCSNLVAGDVAEVQATYPCDMTIPFLGTDFWPSCTLNSQTTVRIE